VLTSESTLRFRDRDEIAASLDRVGFRTTAVRDAPDRPRLELVFSLSVNLRGSPGIPTSLRVEVRASLAI
jgi:hypothetical protein